MEMINSWLQIIGLITVLFFAYKFYLGYKEHKQSKINKRNEKVIRLSHYHPIIHNMFKEYEWKEKQSYERQREIDSINNFPTSSLTGVNIYGRILAVRYLHGVPIFERAVWKKIKELEDNPIEKKKIEDLLKTTERIT